MITIYAKTKRMADGNSFKIYLATLTVAGEPTPVRVRFKGATPKAFPVNIEVNRDTANLATTNYEKDGQQKQTLTLWVEDWTLSDQIYRDSSLDNVEL